MSPEPRLPQQRKVSGFTLTAKCRLSVGTPLDSLSLNVCRSTPPTAVRGDLTLYVLLGDREGVLCFVCLRLFPDHRGRSTFCYVFRVDRYLNAAQVRFAWKGRKTWCSSSAHRFEVHLTNEPSSVLDLRCRESRNANEGPKYSLLMSTTE